MFLPQPRQADGERSAEPHDDVQPAAAEHARQPAHGRRQHPAQRAHDATAGPAAAAGGCDLDSVSDLFQCRSTILLGAGQRFHQISCLLTSSDGSNQSRMRNRGDFIVKTC